MPAGGYFFDALIRQEGEVDEENLNPEDNCEEFGLLTEADCRYYEQAIAAGCVSSRLFPLLSHKGDVSACKVTESAGNIKRRCQGGT